MSGQFLRGNFVLACSLQAISRQQLVGLATAAGLLSKGPEES